jgi:hypothetical protein
VAFTQTPHHQFVSRGRVGLALAFFPFFREKSVNLLTLRQDRFSKGDPNEKKGC